MMGDCHEFHRDRVLGSRLFVIYINDIDDGITSLLLKFADDTKMARNIVTESDCDEPQKDLHLNVGRKLMTRY